MRVDNRPLASAELYVLVDSEQAQRPARRRTCRFAASSAEALQVRDEVKVVDGRMFQFGTNEAIVGRAANRQFAGVDLGSEFTSGNLKLEIVGVFESNGSVGETEIWCDSQLIQGVYERGNSVSVGAREARLTRVVRHVQELADDEPAAERAGAPRERVLRAAVAGR